MKARGRRGARKRPGGKPIRVRLQEAEATLDAIRAGHVDALVVFGPRGPRTLTMEGATHPYIVLLNAMSDGAALLDHRGAILFGNRGLGDITRKAPRALRGSAFQRMVVPAQWTRFEGFFNTGARRKVSQEFLLEAGNGSPTPVLIALSPLSLGGTAAGQSRVRMVIVTDLSSSKQAEAIRIGLLQRVISAEDDERRRVARELHDETGQALTALLVGLRSMTDTPLPRSVRPIALHLRRLAAQTVDEVGRIARGLHPAVLDDTGLATAARRYVRDWARTFGISVQATVRGVDSPKLTPLIASTAYRLLQEALTNVARHARARNVRVVLKRDAHQLELLVQDDGVGFPVSQDSGPRLGLHGMRERTMLLGGGMEMQSRRGAGTTVRARIPTGKDSTR